MNVGRSAKPLASSIDRSLPSYAVIALFPLTVFTMLPVTGVVPILKQLVQDHYHASDIATSLFMSINMIGALVAAPVLGWLSDRFGLTRLILVVAAIADAALWWVISFRPPFEVLMGLRLVEGAAHIGVLSMLMATMSHASAGRGRRARMAGMGGAVIFGVAVGAPLGGILGQHVVELPLQVGSALMLVVAMSALVIIPRSLGSPDPGALPRWPKLFAPPQLRLPYLFGFVDRLSIGVFIITFSLFTATLGFGPRRTGLAIGAFMMTFTILSYPAGRLAERVGLFRLMFVGSVCFGVAYAAIPWLTGAWLWVDMVFCGIFSALMFGPNLMLVVRGSTAETRASAMAGYNAAGSLGFLVGPLLGGGLLQILKLTLETDSAFRSVFATMGVLEVLCVVSAIVILARKQGSARELCAPRHTDEGDEQQHAH